MQIERMEGAFSSERIPKEPEITAAAAEAMEAHEVDRAVAVSAVMKIEAVREGWQLGSEN